MCTGLNEWNRNTEVNTSTAPYFIWRASSPANGPQLKKPPLWRRASVDWINQYWVFWAIVYLFFCHEKISKAVLLKLAYGAKQNVFIWKVWPNLVGFLLDHNKALCSKLYITKMETDAGAEAREIQAQLLWSTNPRNTGYFFFV